MDNIIVITQNVKLPSLVILRKYLKPRSKTLVVSTQYVFDNEVGEIEEYLKTECYFKNFSDILTDEELEECDKEGFDPLSQLGVQEYYQEIKRLKNQKIISKLFLENNFENKLIVSDDLGLDLDTWLNYGFVKVTCDYYHKPINATNTNSVFLKLKNKICNGFQAFSYSYKKPIYVACQDDTKYLFYGNMNRITYRLNLEFKSANKIENFKYYFILHGFFFRSKAVRLSTLHEGINILPDNPKLNLKLIQDGYLPPNYSSLYLKFYGNYTEFYSWDHIGCQTFLFHNLPNRIIPFRKKLYLPSPKYPKQVKKVLCVASGSGDWTALKNRSDEDKMLYVFGKVASMFPNIEFIYRCHPVWVHPQHQGINSINRAIKYIDYLKLPNFKISSNIPNAIEGHQFQLSYKRSSFEEDLRNVDVVFGEHSISMIDAAFKNIIFCSCNVTGRRNFFKSITDIGFPHCESIEEIVDFFSNIITMEFKSNYERAINGYNIMTNREV